MSGFVSFLRRHAKGLAVGAVVVGAVTAMAVRCLPSSEEEMKASAVVVECRTAWVLTCGSRPVLWCAAIDTDSVLRSPASAVGRTATVRLTAGCWMNRWPAVPSCRGRLVAAVPQEGEKELAARRLTDDGCRRVLEKARRCLADSLAWARSEDSELKYYLRVHGVQDEGYQQIASIATRVGQRLTELEAVAARVDSALGSRGRLAFARTTALTAHYRDADGHVRTASCRLLATNRKGRLALLQTADGSTPDGVKAQYLLPWNTTNRRLLAVGFGGLGVEGLASPTAQPLVAEGHRQKRQHDFPRVLVADGCPLFTPRGLFAGMASGREVAGRSEVSQLLMKGGWR